MGDESFLSVRSFRETPATLRLAAAVSGGFIIIFSAGNNALPGAFLLFFAVYPFCGGRAGYEITEYCALYAAGSNLRPAGR